MEKILELNTEASDNIIFLEYIRAAISIQNDPVHIWQLIVFLHAIYVYPGLDSGLRCDGCAVN